MKLLFTFLLCFIFTLANSQDSTALRLSKNITKSSLEKHLKTLASDEYEGRGTGSRGQKKAAFYIKSHFENLGLQPINPKDSAKYYQYFMFKKNAEETSTIDIKSLRKGDIPNNLFYINRTFEMNERAIQVVWAGHGFDYSNIDVKDKIAVVWLGMPNDSIQKKYEINDTKSGILTSIHIKNTIAKKNGAKAVFFIHPDKENFTNFSIRAASMAKFNNKPTSLESTNNTFGNVFFTPKALPRIFGISKNKFNAIFEQGIDFQLIGLINIDVNYNFNNNITENVIGILPGTTKRDEFVIVCAHYDHLGRDGQLIYNGADDNASGTTTLLNLATRFVEAKNAGFANERNIVFIAFSGEELGLLGSEVFTSNMVIPKASIHAVFNIDMVGRGEFDDKNKLGIFIIGDKKSNKRNQKIVNKNFPNVELDYSHNSKNHPERFYYRSDQYNFAKYGIPFIYFNTGTHDDYHRPSDDSDKINYETLQIVAQLIFLNIWEVSY